MLAANRQIYRKERKKEREQWKKRAKALERKYDLNARTYAQAKPESTTLARLGDGLTSPLADWLAPVDEVLEEEGAFDSMPRYWAYLKALVKGFWLERLVYEALSPLPDQDRPFDDVQHSVEPERTPHAEAYFELDVLARRRSRLYAVTVTTDGNADVALSKLHEGLMRARQLGGDEVRVAVVSNATDTKDLRAVADDLAPLRPSMICALGQDDFDSLGSLRAALTPWTKQ